MKAPITLSERRRLSSIPWTGALQHAAVHPLADHLSPAQNGAPERARVSSPGYDFSRARTQVPNCLASPTRCPFGGACHPCPLPVQAKLAVNRPGDEYEQEADRAIEEIVGAQQSAQLHRSATSRVEPIDVPPIVHEVLRSPGQPLDVTTRILLESRFGHDFNQVRVHTDATAADSARAVQALAYTVGRDVVFGAEQYAPATGAGLELLAHELTHILQQSGSLGGNASLSCDQTHGSAELQADEAGRQIARGLPADSKALVPIPCTTLCAQRIGTRVGHTPDHTSPYKKLTARFDGREFILSGDAKELLRVPAQSGRPYAVRLDDARRCGGSADESYLNNPRYVGIEENGPIPEGEYQFRVTDMTTFSMPERYRMLLGGSYTDPFGRSLHGGDWGTGRVALNKVRVFPGRRGCGNTAARSGFYLHGGIMPGSSGCIDIGNSGYQNLVNLLKGYSAPIIVTVRYAYPAPEVGTIKRALGRFTYPPGKEPSLGDRLRSLLGIGD